MLKIGKRSLGYLVTSIFVLLCGQMVCIGAPLARADAGGSSSNTSTSKSSTTSKQSSSTNKSSSRQSSSANKGSSTSNSSSNGGASASYTYTVHLARV